MTACSRYPGRWFATIRLATAVLVIGLAWPPFVDREGNACWIYLRDGVAPGPQEELVEILAVGDVMPGRGMVEVEDVFAEVADELRAADLTIGNLEGALDRGAASGAGIPLLLPTGTPAVLAEAGFDLLSLANNHSLDAGPGGLAETRRQLRGVGIEPIGADPVVVREVAGITFAFIAWNDLGSPSEDEVLAAVRRAHASADHVIVLVHWGKEYQRHPVLPQRERAAALLEAGADILLGSHPHVVQDLQVLDPTIPGERVRLVAYSLGNFAFDQGWDDTGQGLALRLAFDGDGLRAVQARPLWTAPRPHWMNAEDSTALMDRLLTPPRQAFACSQERCWMTRVEADVRSGTFFSGAIDLTGDGVREVVRRTGGTAEIREGEEVVWRTPSDWRVVDLALGDPNDDGRFELLLAIERAHPNGNVVSQPFVIGYRGGRYVDLWGGSPVHSPLLEVELGDIDGNGAEELIVIEAPPGEARRHVTVWRWHGWGFSLVWRSPAGEYLDLLVTPSENGPPDGFSVALGS